MKEEEKLIQNIVKIRSSKGLTKRSMSEALNINGSLVTGQNSLIRYILAGKGIFALYWFCPLFGNITFCYKLYYLCITRRSLGVLPQKSYGYV